MGTRVVMRHRSPHPVRDVLLLPFALLAMGVVALGVSFLMWMDRDVDFEGEPDRFRRNGVL